MSSKWSGPDRWYLSKSSHKIVSFNFVSVQISWTHQFTNFLNDASTQLTIPSSQSSNMIDEKLSTKWRLKRRNFYIIKWKEISGKIRKQNIIDCYFQQLPKKSLLTSCPCLLRFFKTVFSIQNFEGNESLEIKNPFL